MINQALVVGGSGFVGRQIVAGLGETGVGTFKGSPFPGGLYFDAGADRLRTLLRQTGRTFSHIFVLHGIVEIEACARDPESTAKLNVDAAIRLLDDALSAGIKPIYVSTDYVFDGTRGSWREDDEPNPQTIYGAQKVAVEQWLRRQGAPWLIVRLSKVVGSDPATHSVLGQWINEIRAGKTMRCAVDQVFSPAFVGDIAGAMVKLAGSNATGIYHLAGPEAFSRYALIQLLVEAMQTIDPRTACPVEPCHLHEFPFSEKRPLNTSLAIDKIQAAIDWPLKSMREYCRDVAEEHLREGNRH